VDGIHLAQDNDLWWVILNEVINLPSKAGNFSSSPATVR
jgi:hypothetical protein